MTRACFIIACVSLWAAPLAAQRRDTLTLDEVLRAARQQDPRQGQFALEQARSTLRLQRIGADRLPSIRLSAQGQYQSDVTSLAGDGIETRRDTLERGAHFFAPPQPPKSFGDMP